MLLMMVRLQSGFRNVEIMKCFKYVEMAEKVVDIRLVGVWWSLSVDSWEHGAHLGARRYVACPGSYMQWPRILTQGASPSRSIACAVIPESKPLPGILVSKLRAWSCFRAPAWPSLAAAVTGRVCAEEQLAAGDLISQAWGAEFLLVGPFSST